MLSEYLRKDEKNRSKRFEKLVAALLAELTGLRFRIAKSGFQAGRDVSSRDFMENVIAVEAKHYLSSTPLSKRELGGEIAEAVFETPDLDMWVVVTTRDVDSRTHEFLTAVCLNHGINFLHISDESDQLGDLNIIYANAPETVIQYLEDLIDEKEKEQIKENLLKIATHPNFPAKKERLKKELSSPLVGYDSLRVERNNRLIKQFESPNVSRAAFGQILNVADENVHLIPRHEAWSRFDNWCQDWSTKKQPLIVLGEEGDGKTWSIASWIEGKISTNKEFPPTIFVPSINASSENLESIIINEIKNSVDESKTEQFQKRLNRWLNRESNLDQPLFLLILDGINERNPWSYWRSILETTFSELWQSNIAVIITCRTEYWKTNAESLYIPVNDCILQPYDDHELNHALSKYELTHLDIPTNILPLITKPRYFDLMVRHREVMEQSGDVTVPRLIYEDWKDRIQRKRLLSDMTNADFQDLIRNLADKSLSQINDIREKEITELSPTGVDALTILNELRTGGILQGKGTKVTVNEPYLVYGLGLLLVDELKRTDSTDAMLEDKLASWLEPHSDMDIKAKICSFAALHALQQQGISQEIRSLLLDAWISNRNAPEELQQEFTAYIPLAVESYIQLAEKAWAAGIDHRWTQELILKGFLRWKDNEAVISTLVPAFEKWLGYVHPHGFDFQRGKNAEKAEQVREDIETRIGQDLVPGKLIYAGHTLTVTGDDGLLRLGNFALALISHLPLPSVVKALAIGNLAEAIHFILF